MPNIENISFFQDSDLKSKLELFYFEQYMAVFSLLGKNHCVHE